MTATLLAGGGVDHSIKYSRRQLIDLRRAAVSKLNCVNVLMCWLNSINVSKLVYVDHRHLCEKRNICSFPTIFYDML